MASPTATQGTIYSVMGLPELAVMILDYLSVKDLRNVALVNRLFLSSARVLLWRSVALPIRRLGWTDQTPFSQRYQELLARFTRNLSLHPARAHPKLYRRIVDLLDRYWRIRRGRVAQLGGWDSCERTGQHVDEMFDALRSTLSETRTLRTFWASGIPRVLDVISIVQDCRPTIFALFLAATWNDPFSLRSLDDDEDDSSPLGLALGNKTPRANITTAFNLEHLRMLGLQSLMYEDHAWQRYILPLASILRGCHNLGYLDLGLAYNSSGHEQMLPRLCTYYKGIGGVPLELGTLSLGNGCYLNGLPDDSHPLHKLVDLSVLAELRIGIQLSRDDGGRGTVVPAVKLISAGLFPALRRLTCPWKSGLLLCRLLAANPGRIKQLSIQATEQTFAWTPWMRHRYIDQALALLERRPRKESWRPRGLILPSLHAAPGEADDFFVNYYPILPTTSLCIPLPDVRAGHRIQEVWQILAKMQQLRELWFTPCGEDPGRRLVLDEGEARAIAATVASMCPNLWYVRVLDWAWTITAPNVKQGLPELSVLEDVDVTLPEAFDFDKVTL
jgi:hypothetical protein